MIYRILEKYNSNIIKRPILTKCITSFCTFSLGDFLCQRIEIHSKSSQKYNFLRTFKQGAFGFIVTPYLHMQFCKIMPYLLPGKGVIPTVKNIAYDQLIGAPIFLTFFFYYMDLLKGLSLNQATEEFKKKFMPTLYMNWKILPFVMAINVSIMPVPYRVLYANIAGIFWSIYLSFTQNSG